jgi:hypothetical protein
MYDSSACADESYIISNMNLEMQSRIGIGLISFVRSVIENNRKRRPSS